LQLFPTLAHRPLPMIFSFQAPLPVEIIGSHQCRADPLT
jgi:hypothetical protein